MWAYGAPSASIEVTCVAGLTDVAAVVNVLSGALAAVRRWEGCEVLDWMELCGWGKSMFTRAGTCCSCWPPVDDPRRIVVVIGEENRFD